MISEVRFISNKLISSKSKSLTGIAIVPGDKSMSHRALMLGAVAKGETIVNGMLEGEDVLCTAEAMRNLGASVIKCDNGSWKITGVTDGFLCEPDVALDMGNSGTSVRLMLGLVAGHRITVSFSGDKSLSKRPMKRVIIPLEQMGASFPEHNDFCLPLTMNSAGNLKSIEYHLPVASAQVKSAILLAGLRAGGKTTVIEDMPTRDHTENMLRHFGVNVETYITDDGALAASVDGGQVLVGCDVNIPADPSSVAFPVVAAILIEDSEICLPRVGINKRRAGLYSVLQEMGADIVFENEHMEAGEPVADITVKNIGALKGIDVSPEIVPSMIDEFPVLAMVAACAEGTTCMSGLAELRVKESDRLLLVAEGLKACGVELEMGEDWLKIHGNGKPPRGGELIKTELDHRIAMSFLVLGCVSAEPIEIDDGSPINTSFPGFVDLMNGLGANIRTFGDVA